MPLFLGCSFAFLMLSMMTAPVAFGDLDFRILGGLPPFGESVLWVSGALFVLAFGGTLYEERWERRDPAGYRRFKNRNGRNG